MEEQLKQLAEEEYKATQAYVGRLSDIQLNYSDKLADIYRRVITIDPTMTGQRWFHFVTAYGKEQKDE